MGSKAVMSPAQLPKQLLFKLLYWFGSNLNLSGWVGGWVVVTSEKPQSLTYVFPQTGYPAICNFLDKKVEKEIARFGQKRLYSYENVAFHSEDYQMICCPDLPEMDFDEDKLSHKNQQEYVIHRTK